MCIYAYMPVFFLHFSVAHLALGRALYSHVKFPT